MIRGLLQIGSVVQESQPWKSGLDRIRGKGEKYVLKVNFRRDGSLDIIAEEYVPDRSEEKYKLVKLTLTGRQNQFMVSFKEMENLVNEKGKIQKAWVSLINEMESRGMEIPGELREIREIFYDENNRLKEKYVQQIQEKLNQLGISNRKIAFFTILIDGTPISSRDYYEEILNRKMLEDKLNRGKWVVCYGCGKEVDEYITDHARITMKLFITDKVGFSQYARDRWEGNFALCRDCYIKFYSGQSFVLKNFSDAIGKINYVVIPEFLLADNLSREKLLEWKRHFDSFYNPFKFVESMEELKEDIDRFVEYETEGDTFWVNYMFYKKDQSAFNIYGEIKDIPRGRLREIKESVLKVLNGFRDMNMPVEGDIGFRSLGDVYYLIPLRVHGRNIVGISRIVDLFDRLFNGISVYREELIEDFLLGSRIHFYGTGGYHISPSGSEMGMVGYIYRTHQFLTFLKQLYGIKGGEIMLEPGILDEDMVNYIETLGLDEQETSLFLLGYVIGEIGKKQFLERPEGSKSKPILNKINFQGMDRDRLMLLFLEIFEKIKQMELYWLEKIYALAKELADRNIKGWRKSPQENVYYILSGYSYATLRAIKGGLQNVEK